MRRRTRAVWKWTLVGLLGLAAPAIGGRPVCRAAGISPWAGARTDVTALNYITTTDVGRSAAGSVQKGIPITYRSWIQPNGSDLWQTSASGSAAAAASGSDPSQLLRVSTSYNTRSGYMTAPVEVPPVRASASWNDEQITLHSASGAPLPESVRLHLNLEFSDNLRQFGKFTVKFGEQEVTFLSNDDNRYISSPLYYTSPADADNTSWDSRFHRLDYGENLDLPPGFDRLTQSADPNTMFRGLIHGELHMDVPLDALGQSDLFRLAIESDVSLGLPYRADIDALHENFTLGLADITLIDGTSLADAGLSATFASGLGGEPTPVPEPGTFVAWTLVGVGVVLVRRRKGRAE
jgi:hypothetical protein